MFQEHTVGGSLSTKEHKHALVIFPPKSHSLRSNFCPSKEQYLHLWTLPSEKDGQNFTLWSPADDARIHQEQEAVFSQK